MQSKVGGIPEIIQPPETGWLAPVGDHAALAAAIIEAWQQPQEAQKRAAAGRSRVEQHFSADAMVEGTLTVYRDLLEAPTATEETPA